MNPERFIPTSLPHGVPKIDNPLAISWHDSSWIPMLNTGNIMDYFSERTNPFYDRTCNNENLKMQRLGPEHLGNMIGLEYCLLHVQEPILYVIRKQHRHSPTQVTPIADYYILAGVVYQAPDLASVIGSRLLTMVHHMQTAFDEDCCILSARTEMKLLSASREFPNFKLCFISLFAAMMKMGLLKCNFGLQTDVVAVVVFSKYRHGIIFKSKHALSSDYSLIQPSSTPIKRYIWLSIISNELFIIA